MPYDAYKEHSHDQATKNDYYRELYANDRANESDPWNLNLVLPRIEHVNGLPHDHSQEIATYNIGDIYIWESEVLSVPVELRYRITDINGYGIWGDILDLPPTMP